MAVRELVRIDEELCTGCGDCVTACAEGAIQIVDGKAKLVSDIYCDGLGACLGHCPEDAISIERVEAKAFDEAAVERHLATLEDRGGIAALAGAGAVPPRPAPQPALRPPMGGGGGCPGSRVMAFAGHDSPASEDDEDESGSRPSQLRQWPVQLHLVSPYAPYFRGADVLLAADCTAYATGDFHKDHLKGHGLAIACPKLDDGRDIYVDKLTAMIDESQIASLTVLVMEVPCCSGLVGMAKMARDRAARDIPIRCRTIGVRGDVIDDSML